MDKEIAYRWRPIADLPYDWQSLSDGEFAGLVDFWKDQRSDAEVRGLVDEVMVRMKREWAIETGAIEDIYQLDRGVTKTLIERGIEATLIPHGSARRGPEWVAQVILDQQGVLEHLFDFVASRRELTEGYIKEAHAALTRNQDTRDALDQFGNVIELKLNHGVYKEMPNSPTRPDGRVHEFCPPLQVGPEMERLLAIHRSQQERGVSPEIQAAWLHHAFTQIHPFEDGNGRLARVLASLVLLKHNGFPFTIRMEDRSQYIDALERADTGDIGDLVRLVVTQQRGASIVAVTALGAVAPNGTNGKRPSTIDEALESAKATLLLKGLINPPTWTLSCEHAERLLKYCQSSLTEVVARLAEIGNAGQGFNFSSEGERVVRELKQSFDIPVNAAFQGIVRLHFGHAQQHSRLSVVFASIGAKHRGMIGVKALWDGTPIKAGLFQINYCESLESTEMRFKHWMESTVASAVSLWQQTL